MIDVSPELLERCQCGDRAAFSQLVLETQSGVYNLAYSVLRNHDEALDASQEIYLRVWRALSAFRGESRFSTWLYRVAINACLNRRRKLRTQLSVVEDEQALDCAPTPEAGPAASTLERERNTALWEAVGRLSEKYRLVIILFYQQEMGYQEIADLLSLPLGTVKAHLNRARAALAKQLLPEKERVHVTL